MSHSIEQVLNKVTVWCEQSSLSELVTFDLSYKRITKCKTWVKTGCIQVLLQKLISNSDALAHFWGQVGNCVWRQHRQLKFHRPNLPAPPIPPLSHLSPPPPIHQLWDDRWRRRVGAILQICHSHRRLFEQTDPARNLSSSRPCLLICHHLFDLLPGFQKELLNIGPKRYNKIEMC